MRLLKRALRLVLAVVVGYYAFCILGLFYVRSFAPPTTMVQVQRRLESFVTPGAYTKRSIWRPLAELPVHVPRAVIAAEDARFFTHEGFDWRELEQAGEQAVRRRRPPRGASTITQQLVKNLFLTTHRSVIRKVVEWSLTPIAELILPKRRILELYLNEIEWGPGIYGIEAAARHHYRVPATRLDREQAARLAAVIPAPLRRRPERMGNYARIILARMAAVGW